MSDKNESIVPGFGLRLREERRRLGLSQEAFADLAGVKRLAQSQYESEVREPRLSYLSAICKHGVNLHYVLYGAALSGSSAPSEEMRRIEKTVFDLIEKYVSTQCGGRLSAEGRYVLFEVMRAHCIQTLGEGGYDEISLLKFLPGKAA